MPSVFRIIRKGRAVLNRAQNTHPHRSITTYAPPLSKSYALPAPKKSVLITSLFSPAQVATIDRHKYLGNLSQSSYSSYLDKRAFFTDYFRGTKGEAGAKGERGEAGAKGERGEAGPRGEKGEAGAKGERGEAGPRGEKGEAGVKGERGEAGPRGEKGEPGSKGERGEIGSSASEQNSKSKDSIPVAIMLALFAGLLAEHLKEYFQINAEIQGGIEEGANVLKMAQILYAQPRLYLNRTATPEEKKSYNETYMKLTQIDQRLNFYAERLRSFPTPIPSILLLTEIENLGWGRLFHKALLSKIDERRQIIQVAIEVNQAIWLQKNKQYKEALDINEKIINYIKKMNKEGEEKKIEDKRDKTFLLRHLLLEAYNTEDGIPLEISTEIIDNIKKTSKEKEEKKIEDKRGIFSLNQFLPGVYNAQAKLKACLAFHNITPEEKKILRKESLEYYDDAIDAINALREHTESPIDTDLANLLASKGHLLLDCGEPKKALKLFQEAQCLLPGDPNILAGIGRALFEIGIEEKERKQETAIKTLDYAYGYITAALKTDPNATSYTYRSKILNAMDDKKGAAEDLKKALALDEYHSEANQQQAVHCCLAGDEIGAKRHFSMGMLYFLSNRSQADAEVIVEEKLADLKKSAPACHINTGFKPPC